MDLIINEVMKNYTMLDIIKIQKQLSYNHVDSERYTDWLDVEFENIEIQIYQSGEVMIINHYHKPIINLQKFADIIEIINHNQKEGC